MSCPTQAKQTCEEHKGSIPYHTAGGGATAAAHACPSRYVLVPLQYGNRAQPKNQPALLRFCRAFMSLKHIGHGIALDGVAGFAGVVTLLIAVFGLTVLPVTWWALTLVVLGLLAAPHTSAGRMPWGRAVRRHPRYARKSRQWRDNTPE